MKQLLLIPGIIGLLAIPKITSGEFDLPGLNKQVQTQQTTLDQHAQVLDNHEARITNLEKDTTTLQENTSTPTNNDHVPVPDVTPAPKPVTPPEPQPTDPPTPPEGYTN